MKTYVSYHLLMKIIFKKNLSLNTYAPHSVIFHNYQKFSFLPLMSTLHLDLVVSPHD